MTTTSIDILTDARALVLAGEPSVARAISHAAARRDAWAKLPHTQAAAAIHAAVGAPGLDLIRWNEAPGRTQADVLTALDRALAAERAQAGGAA